MPSRPSAPPRSSVRLATTPNANDLHIGRDEAETFARLVADWRAQHDPEGTIMIAHTRADVAELNEHARALMRVDGQLGSEEVFVDRAPFARGDQILVRRNDLECDVRNGERGMAAVDVSSGEIVVRIDGRAARLDRRFLEARGPNGRASVEHELRDHCLRRTGDDMLSGARPRT